MSLLTFLIGPRIPNDDLSRRWYRYAAPTLFISLARVMLLVSLFLPYWHIKLKAPQYPKRDLQINAYVNRVEGDMREINGLNHYIGMRPLDQAAQWEKAIGVYAIIGMVLLMEAAMFVHSRWAAVLLLPVLLFPAIFLLDLWYWLHLFGQNLDPKAALSRSIKPFTPPALGVGVIGQFKTVAWMGQGLWLAWASAAMTLVAILLHRFAYRPLYLKAKRDEERTRQVTAAAASKGGASCVA